MVWTKRPGTGIPANDIDKIIDSIARVDIEKDTLIEWSQIKS